MVDRLIDADLDHRLLFNQKTTALLIGISVQAFSKWGIQPAERQGRETFYYWPTVLEERDLRYYGEDDDTAGAERLDLDQERARQSKEQADKLALENAGTRGEIVFSEHMAEVMARALTAFRARLLASPSKLAPLVSPGNPNRARDIIERELTDVLAELADVDPGPELGERDSNSARTVRNSMAAAKADGKSVGGRRKKVKQRK